MTPAPGSPAYGEFVVDGPELLAITLLAAFLGLLLGVFLQLTKTPAPPKSPRCPECGAKTDHLIGASNPPCDLGLACVRCGWREPRPFRGPLARSSR